ncbi:ligase-associated DNA damage response DEXH box helicase [Legionella dresdenensis]|uniref:Ligase-associated DNA damage response DEXH box helicase n=1 Tax=Legionella dresdenensis TaxID=450200 RepID=A0ABV8CEE3_9GAMM
MIPDYIINWFSQKGWQMHDYQQSMFKLAAGRQSVLLIAPTGGGKTLASFLPSLVDIHQNHYKGLHTLYISPLKALTNDIQRNLLLPVKEMGLNVTIQSRTGDTSSYQRQRMRQKPPDILLTTPESLLLMLSYPDADQYFSQLKAVIVDEIHNIVPTKRGDLLALALAQINAFSPQLMAIGLSATVAKPEQLANWLSFQKKKVTILPVVPSHKPQLHLLTSDAVPYSGFMAQYAVDAIYQIIKTNNTTIVFVNTRAQVEFLFHRLWLANENSLPIAVYHGSLSKEQRLKTEHMAVAGKIRAIVTTSALELGIDWGNVDAVIQVGAPHGVSRLLQRIGRSNHQFDQSSLAYLVPANCFDALECQAAINAVNKGGIDGEELHPGSLDVVVQFIINAACSRPVSINQVYKIVRMAYPYRKLKKTLFEKLFQFAVNGGYTLQHYEQYHRLLPYGKYRYQIASARVTRRHRQNIGTIIEAARLKIKVLNKRKDKIIGDVEEAFAQQLTPGDTFLFAGEILEFVAIRDMMVEVRKGQAKTAKIPSYNGGTMPLSTYLAAEVRQLINSPAQWGALPDKVQNWLKLQQRYSQLPANDTILVEQFYYRKTHYIIIYSFEGRRANYTLGMLISRRMEEKGLKPLNFTATDYGLALGALREASAELIHSLLSTAIIYQQLEQWLQQSPLLKRTFRQIAVISGLTQRQIAGQRKTMKQVTFSTDLIYDVLVRHEPEHVLLAITRHDVTKTLLDIERLSTMLMRFVDKIVIKKLTKPSPFAIPILTTFKTEKIQGEAEEELLSYAEIEAQAVEMINAVKTDLDGELNAT